MFWKKNLAIFKILLLDYNLRQIFETTNIKIGYVTNKQLHIIIIVDERVGS